MIDEFSTGTPSHPLQVDLRFRNLRPKGPARAGWLPAICSAKRPHLLAEMRIMQDGQG